MKKINLNFREEKKGLSVRYRTKKFDLIYPNSIWKNYPKQYRKVLFDNIAYLLTVCMPLVARANEVNYNTANPLIKKEVEKVVIKNLMGATEGYKKEKPSELIKKFKEIRYNFNGNTKQLNSYKADVIERANIAFSCGKDSLLSLGVCNELGLNPILTYINDTVSPTENKVKIIFLKKIAKQLKLQDCLVRNEFEKLNDFESWRKPESCIGYSHLLTSFCLLSLPVCYKYNAKYIILGNEQDMEFKFVNKEGKTAFISFEQSLSGTSALNKLTAQISFNQHNIFSIIKPLTDVALVKVLHGRYKDIAKYQVSCPSLDTNKELRWCHGCSTCTTQYLFFKAHNIDTKIAGFNKNLLEKNFKDFFALFNGKKIEVYDKGEDIREEELIAFYLAYKNKASGYLIDLFKKQFLNEAKEKEDYLYNKFFKIHPSDMPPKIKREVISIYKEELNL